MRSTTRERSERLVFSRSPDDDAELDAWADNFAVAILDSEEQQVGKRDCP
jgi:hypothetical protein